MTLPTLFLEKIYSKRKTEDKPPTSTITLNGSSPWLKQTILQLIGKALCNGQCQNQGLDLPEWEEREITQRVLNDHLTLEQCWNDEYGVSQKEWVKKHFDEYQQNAHKIMQDICRRYITKYSLMTYLTYSMGKIWNGFPESSVNPSVLNDETVSNSLPSLLKNFILHYGKTNMNMNVNWNDTPAPTNELWNGKTGIDEKYADAIDVPRLKNNIYGETVPEGLINNKTDLAVLVALFIEAFIYPNNFTCEWLEALTQALNDHCKKAPLHESLLLLLRGKLFPYTSTTKTQNSQTIQYNRRIQTSHATTLGQKYDQDIYQWEEAIIGHEKFDSTLATKISELSLEILNNEEELKLFLLAYAKEPDDKNAKAYILKNYWNNTNLQKMLSSMFSKAITGKSSTTELMSLINDIEAAKDATDCWQNLCQLLLATTTTQQSTNDLALAKMLLIFTGLSPAAQKNIVSIATSSEKMFMSILKYMSEIKIQDETLLNKFISNCSEVIDSALLGKIAKALQNIYLDPGALSPENKQKISKILGINEVHDNPFTAPTVTTILSDLQFKTYNLNKIESKLLLIENAEVKLNKLLLTDNLGTSQEEQEKLKKQQFEAQKELTKLESIKYIEYNNESSPQESGTKENNMQLMPLTEIQSKLEKVRKSTEETQKAQNRLRINIESSSYNSTTSLSKSEHSISKYIKTNALITDKTFIGNPQFGSIVPIPSNNTTNDDPQYAMWTFNGQLCQLKKIDSCNSDSTIMYKPFDIFIIKHEKPSIFSPLYLTSPCVINGKEDPNNINVYLATKLSLTCALSGELFSSFAVPDQYITNLVENARKAPNNPTTLCDIFQTLQEKQQSKTGINDALIMQTNSPSELQNNTKITDLSIFKSTKLEPECFTAIPIDSKTTYLKTTEVLQSCYKAVLTMDNFFIPMFIKEEPIEDKTLRQSLDLALIEFNIIRGIHNGSFVRLFEKILEKEEKHQTMGTGYLNNLAYIAAHSENVIKELVSANQSKFINLLSSAADINWNDEDLGTKLGSEAKKLENSNPNTSSTSTVNQSNQ